MATPGWARARKPDPLLSPTDRRQGRGASAEDGARLASVHRLTPLTNLPSRVSSFVGREDDVTALTGLLETSRLVTLTGPAGVGKSRLAVRVAEQAAPLFPDGVWMVELASVDDPARVPAAVASVLSVPEQPSTSLSRAVAAALARRRVLLLLDNCEHLVAAAARFVEALLETCADLSVLTTSQEALALCGESRWQVAPLSVPDGHAPGTEADLQRYDAIRLFCQRASAVQPRFCLDAGTGPFVAEICRRLDGVPLAIELAAGRLNTLGVSEIARRLETGLEVLAAPRRGGEERHQTLESATDWSFRLLSEREKVLLRRLSVFSGSFGVSGAEDVCSGGALAQGAVVQTLTGLVTKSFVSAEVGGDSTRYRLLETVRRYALVKLGESGEEATLRERHARWCVALAEEAEAAVAGDQRQSLERLGCEHDNLRAALSWSIEAGRGDVALPLATSLTLFWRLRGHLSEGLAFLEGALALAKEGDAALRAKALWGAALFAAVLGVGEGGVGYGEAALELARQEGDTITEARASSVLGFAHLTRGEVELAIPSIERGVALARRVGDAWCLADSLRTAGLVHMTVGDAPAARVHFGECLAVARVAGDSQALVLGLMGTGWVEIEQGDYEHAEDLMREALALSEPLHQLVEAADLLVFLGDLARRRRDYDEARLLFQRALDHARAMEVSVTTARALGGLGRVSLAAGQAAEAVRFFEEAVAVARAHQHSFVLARCLYGLAKSLDAMGDLDSAVRLHEEVRAVGQRARDKAAVAGACHELGLLAQRRGDLDAATSLHHQSLALCREVGLHGGTSACVEAFGSLAARRGRWEVAARLFGAAQSLEDAPGGGFPSAPDDILRTAALVDEARQHLGAEGFAAAWAEGSKLSEDEALAYAGRRGGSRGRRPSVGWESLSPTERDVVRLVRDGLTNREVAERLFISARTVTTHLTHVYAKLGITSRQELRQAKASDNT